MSLRLINGILAALACAIALNVACSDPTPPAAPTPVPASIRETFTGTIDPLSQQVHAFVVKQVGTVQVTLTTVQPSVQLKISVGTPSSATGTCAAEQTVNTSAGTTPQLSGTATTTGNFCISVADFGNLTGQGTYTVVVFHS
jgi:hypothetical protein